MCIICIKAAGAKNPSKKMLQKMAQGNPDLCGFSYQSKNSVITHRGLQEIELIKLLPEIPLDSIAMFHFRQATSGDINTLNSHPFPLYENKAQQCATSKYSLAHNGVFFDGGELESDTLQTVKLMERSKPFSAALDWIEIVTIASHSKTSILTPNNVITYGNFSSLPEYPGLSFSNLNWKNILSYFSGSDTWKSKYTDTNWHNAHHTGQYHYDDTSSDGINKCTVCESMPLIGRERLSGLCYKCKALFLCEGCGIELKHAEIVTGVQLCEICQQWEINHGKFLLPETSNTTTTKK